MKQGSLVIGILTCVPFLATANAQGTVSIEKISRARFIGYPSGGHLGVGYQKEVVSEITAFLK